MLGRRKGTRLRLSAKLVLSVFLGLILFGSWGCEPSTRRTSSSMVGVDAVGAVPSQKSEALLQAEIEKRFESPQAHYELAVIYHQQHQWVKAEYEYMTALGFEPGNTGAQAGYVRMLTDLGEKAKAQQFADKYVSQAASIPNESLRLAWDFKKVGLDDLTLRCFRQALEAAPNSAEVNKQVGMYYLGKGDTAKAKDHLSRSFQANPNQPDVAGALGRLGVVVQAPQEPEAPRTGKTTK
jgi:Tfp pilus assembly protein PilF